MLIDFIIKGADVDVYRKMSGMQAAKDYGDSR